MPSSAKNWVRSRPAGSHQHERARSKRAPSVPAASRGPASRSRRAAAEPDAVGEAHRRVFGAHPPASTMVGVSALATPDYLVEIEADAVLPSTVRS